MVKSLQIICLFKDAFFSCIGYVASNGRIIYRLSMGKIWRGNSSVTSNCLERLGKTTQTLTKVSRFPSRDSNPDLP